MDDTYSGTNCAFILDLHIVKGFGFENQRCFVIFVEDSWAFYILLFLDFQFCFVRSSVLFMLFMFIYSSLGKESARISVSETFA